MSPEADSGAATQRPLSPGRIGFNTLLHADWSMRAEKRWFAKAVRDGDGWRVSAPKQLRNGTLPARARVPDSKAVGDERIPDTKALVDALFTLSGPVLAGFDFPIGVPAAYGQLTKFGDFTGLLPEFGGGDWRQFVAKEREDITLKRPFYPMAPGGRSMQHLIDKLRVADKKALFRKCELASNGGANACPLFWTLGGNQVGKGAITGWQEVIIPALDCGARLWPFHGSLADLAARGAPVLAETYPAEAYGHVGVKFQKGKGLGKTSKEGRLKAMARLSEWTEPNRVTFDEALVKEVDEGFGDKSCGEDRFDALTGLLGMIEVVDGRRPEGPPADEVHKWEGWIMGKSHAG